MSSEGLPSPKSKAKLVSLEVLELPCPSFREEVTDGPP
jgi:hypothetical protein